MGRTSKPLAVLICLGLLPVTLALTHVASRFTVNWFVIGAGGGQMRSARHVMSGTVGQVADGRISGGRYRIDAGFWPGLAVVAPSPTLTPTGTVLPATVPPTATLTPTGTVVSATQTPTSSPTATGTDVPSMPSATPTTTATVEPTAVLYLPLIAR